MGDNLSYRKSGVDLDAAEKANKKIAKLAKSTFNKNVLTEIGSFGGIYSPPEMGDNVLVSSVDGVGTKLMVAAKAGKLNTVGSDLVNHCINDIAVMGAKPMFFLDYIGYADLEPEEIAEIVEGLSDACKKSNIALIGGETAQMPGVYPENQFDLVGMIVGMVNKNKIIDGSEIQDGDKIIAIESNGLHTNGYSLARKAFKGVHLGSKYGDETLGELLLKIHRCYLEHIQAVTAKVNVKGMAHITGGGIEGNFSRILPDNLGAVVDKNAVKVPKIFRIIAERGVDEDEMYRVFNMGFGFMMVVSCEDVDTALKTLEPFEYSASLVGEIVENIDGIELR